MTVRTRSIFAVVGVGVLLGFGLWSWASNGVVRALVDGAFAAGDNAAALESLRAALERWGPLAPVIYVVAVVIEVTVAPIPGTLLYAPAGALWGGFQGGLLSLIGNTLGAMVAGAIASAVGEEAMARKLEGSRVATYVDRLRERGVWVILLLRLNPLTSSDLVSYAAGAIGIPVWRIGLGTFIGMAPLCFAQAYLAAEIFDVLPGAVYVLVGAALLYVGFVVVWLIRPRRIE
jgi:uncharacterized membrane protein YdjX (TVP38/TMEM64 family)